VIADASGWRHDTLTSLHLPRPAARQKVRVHAGSRLAGGSAGRMNAFRSQHTLGEGSISRRSTAHPASDLPLLVKVRRSSTCASFNYL
jgi:hypothetical protein